MELIKLSNKQSKKVESYSQIIKQAEELTEFFDKTNGNFKGEHQSAFALAHCQVSDDPYAFFVVTKEIVDDYHLLPSRLIINAEVYDGKDEKRMIEGCMSFPFRKAKKVNRFSIISARFDVVDEKGRLEHVEVKEMKEPLSQIFQHEVDHLNGKNIYFD